MDRSKSLSAEATDLTIHVEMCALRHQEIKEELKETRDAAEKRLSRIERVLWGLLTLAATTLGVAIKEVAPLLRLLSGAT